MTLEKENSITKTGKTRLLLIMAVVGAFVAGSLTAGPFAFAQLSQCQNNPPRGIGGGPVWGEVWAAICELEDRIDDISSSTSANIKHVTLQDGNCQGTIPNELGPTIYIGWCPGEGEILFLIQDADYTEDSVVEVSVFQPEPPQNLHTSSCHVEDSTSTGPINPNDGFLVGCFPQSVDDGARLNYLISNPQN